VRQKTAEPQPTPIDPFTSWGQGPVFTGVIGACDAFVPPPGVSNMNLPRLDIDPNEIALDLRSTRLVANLQLPFDCRGLVMVAHGGDTTRQSVRDREVVQCLRRTGMGTLHLDLLTEDEGAEDAVTHHLRYDVHLLAERLVDATDWVATDPHTAGLPIGYCGVGTGAAAALVAAARRATVVRAIVSRSGRPDLAGGWLYDVRAPTLLIVGGDDVAVLDFNEEAYDSMRCLRELLVIPNAGHLFEEPGTLAQATEASCRWLAAHLGTGAVPDLRH
jgi:putative phosphoribosyl transferase